MVRCDCSRGETTKMKIRNGDQRLDPFQPSVAAVDQAWSETQEISERGGVMK